MIPIIGMNRVISRISDIETKFGPKFSSETFSKVLTNALNQSEAGRAAGQPEALIRAAAAKHGVDPKLALAVARAESNLSQTAVSSAGAVGVMQLMPDTAKALGVRNIYDMHENIDGGVRYLQQMLATFQGDASKAVAAYNAGPEAVKRYHGVPPYPETSAYVAKVLSDMENH